MTDLVVVVGPTASGKTSLALDLAERLGGPDRVEIINADSMQVYGGMDIGTAKIPLDQRRGITHHLFDVWPVTHSVAVAEYQVKARAAVADIRERGKLPIAVGGSGLYVSAMIDDLQFPATDPGVRARLEAELAEVGTVLLHQRLRALDPAAAERIPPRNGRRIVRALEVIELTGQPFSATLPTTPREVLRAVQIGIDWPNEQLYSRIATRVDLMWADGFVAEVRSLRDELERGRTAARALGYAQVLAFLRGDISQEQARNDTIVATRRFARRQRSWFRRDARITWFAGDQADLIDAAHRALDAAYD